MQAISEALKPQPRCSNSGFATKPTASSEARAPPPQHRYEPQTQKSVNRLATYQIARANSEKIDRVQQMQKQIVAAILIAALATGGRAPGQEPRPVLGGNSWQIVDRLPGVSHRACAVRKNGSAVDTMLMLNNNNQPILVAGRNDWSDMHQSLSIAIAIDGGAPVNLSAAMLGNLVLVLVTNDALVTRLRHAHSIRWILPFGQYQADVTGLSVALDALIACAGQAERAQ